MSVNYTPNMGEYKPTGSFKFWCQKVLPLVYDDSLSYYETLCKVTNYLNDVIKNSDTLDVNVRGLYDAYVLLQNYVNNYFDNVDFPNLVNEKLDTMASDGSLSALIQPLFDEYKSTIDNTVNKQNNDINVLKSRMDTFTSLQNGSTTGDAELIDIRVKADGMSATSAGNAVREQVNELKGDLSDLYDIVKINNITYENGYYIEKSNGTKIQHNNGFTVSDYVEVKPNTKYILYTHLNSDIIAICGYNYVNGAYYFNTFAKSLSDATKVYTNNEKYVFTTPNEITHIRFSIFNAGVEYTQFINEYVALYEVISLQHLEERVESLEEKINAPYKLEPFVLFDNVLCIGDSLTEGYYYYKDVNGTDSYFYTKSNYTEFLRKINNIDNVDNGGHSGTNTLDWYNAYVENYNYTNYDGIIIFFGTNGGFTDTIEQDTASGNYETYSETNTGYYCKLIEKIRSVNPYVHIILIKPYVVGGGDKAVTNSVIDKIAIKYNVDKVIDTNSEDFANTENTLYHYNNNVHLTKIGYYKLARFISKNINEYLFDKPRNLEKCIRAKNNNIFDGFIHNN